MKVFFTYFNSNFFTRFLNFCMDSKNNFLVRQRKIFYSNYLDYYHLNVDIVVLNSFRFLINRNHTIWILIVVAPRAWPHAYARSFFSCARTTHKQHRHAGPGVGAARAAGPRLRARAGAAGMAGTVCGGVLRAPAAKAGAVRTGRGSRGVTRVAILRQVGTLR